MNTIWRIEMIIVLAFANISNAASNDINVVTSNPVTVYGRNLSGNRQLEKSATGTMHPIILGSDKLEIWPVGDSITYGSFGTNGGYRGFLYTLLSAEMLKFQFVGSSTLNGGVALPAAQRHNDGHAAYSIANICTNLDGADNSVFLRYHFPSTDGHWLTGIVAGTNARPALFPDITLLLVGANERGNPKGAQDRLDNLVSKMVTLRPSTHLIVARITPIPACSNFVNTFNEGVDCVVAKYAVSNFVTEVDLNTGFPTNGLSKDNLHPNDTGYSWMAGRWFNAIRSCVFITH